MTLTLDYIRKKLGWCPNAGSSRHLNRMLGGPNAESQNALQRSDMTPQGAGNPGDPGKRRYEHTQVGRVIIAAVMLVMIVIIGTQFVLGGSLVMGSLSVPAEEDLTVLIGGILIPLTVLGILVVVVLCFGTLTVAVFDDAVRIRFGPIALFRREFPLSEIASVTAVTNPWYYGYGIRWTPKGPLYNVSGKDAVELELYSGKNVRIGTDEPGVLLREIEQARKGRKSS